MNLLDASATALLAGFRDGRCSPADYVAELIPHIHAWEPHINALYAYDEATLTTAAAEATQRWHNGTPMGALDGIPVTIKELIATRGVPIPQGTAVTELTPAREDAPPSARLREDHALIFAKTTCPDFGMMSSGVSTFHGLTRNPWKLDTNPGGSSSGAGAAAAAGLGPLHVGTDIGGSVRLPAAWCGLVGFKPTLGRIPIDPYYTGRCAGPMTRTVEDAALLMATLSRTDRRDATRLPPDSIDWMNCSLDLSRLRLGVMLDAGCGMDVDPEILATVETVAAQFERAGATLVPVAPVMTRAMLDGLDNFWRARQWKTLATLSEADRDRVFPMITQWAASGAELSAVDVVHGFEQTFAMRRTTEAAFDDVDAILSPTTPLYSFPAEYGHPSNDPERPFEHLGFTLPWNMGEQPALSINAGFSREGLPIGVQLIAPRFEDQRVLKLAHAFETWRGPIRCWPRPPAR
ncbi:amidase [Salinicola corii]|uniref:Amidase n=1 Tax=Salinicola corii TaxID=2606937 RepID=A0A640WHS1_9GAMM|nr:amidase [Salinicola corii]KAA0019859.1 amidase [Salinicola corii]